MLQCHTLKHLEMYHDEKLKFFKHIKQKILKTKKGIEVIWKLRHILPRH